MSTALLVLVALLPAIALMIYIYFQDKHGRQPIGLLLAIFGLGIVSCGPTMLLEWGSLYALEATFGGVSPIMYLVLYSVFGVALIEEGFKFLAAFILTKRSRHFNYKFDGIIYCLFASMGFAGTENIIYLVTENAITGSSDAVLKLGIQRGLLAIPLHAMCAIFMGYYYGNAKYAKSYRNRSGYRRNILLGLTISTLLHAFYDFCLFTGNNVFYILFFVFVVIADVFTLIRIHFAKKNNQEMYIAPQYKGFWIGPAADPYQPFSGYQAPSYGGYNYGGGTAPNPAQDNSRFMPPNQSQYMPGQSGNNYSPTPAPQYVPNNFRNQMVRCPNCGEANNFNAFYCSSCGASLHLMPQDGIPQ